MASSSIANFPDSLPVPAAPACRAQANRRRHISPEAGNALEKLGHAIEYLTDEFVHHGEEIFPRNAQLEAVQLLMRVNRQVYFECPEIRSLRDCLRSILHLPPA